MVEVHVELVEVQRVVAVVQHVVGRARRRRSNTIDVRREQAAHRRFLLKADLGCGLPGQHGRAVVGTGVGAHEGVALEHVEGLVVGVGPDTHLGIVVEIVVLKRIAIPGAGRIGVDGDGNALQVRRRGNGHLAHDPARGKLVVEHDGIAVIVGLAASAKSQPQGISRRGAGQQRAHGLVEDCEVSVHPLHILRSSHCAVGIGRTVLDREAVLSVANALKVQANLGREAGGGHLTDWIFVQWPQARRKRNAAPGFGFQLAVRNGVGIADHVDQGRRDIMMQIAADDGGAATGLRQQSNGQNAAQDEGQDSTDRKESCMGHAVAPAEQFGYGARGRENAAQRHRFHRQYSGAFDRQMRLEAAKFGGIRVGRFPAGSGNKKERPGND